MASRTSPSGRLALRLTVVLTLAGLSGALQQTYCSNQNTASGGASYWTWQSNGWCSNNCQSSYAFAVVQGNNCWCSDYVPAAQQSVGDCNVNCPGYPSEKCGDASSGLFGYVALSKAPSGTIGASSAAPSSTEQSTSQAPSAPPSSSPVSQHTVVDPSTVYQTVTQSPSVVVSFVTPIPSSTPPPPSSTPASIASSSQPPSSTPASIASSSQPPSSQPPSPTPPPPPPPPPPTSTQQPSSTQLSTEAPSSTWSPTPVTTVMTSTASGQVVTLTVTMIPTAPPDHDGPVDRGVSGGTVAGAVVGSVAGVALIGACLFWVFFRRRRQQDQDEGNTEIMAGDNVGASKSGFSLNSPRRNTSTMSKTGLLRSEKPYPPTIQTRNSVYGVDDETISPESERRSSRPLMYDQRLNPDALMMSKDNGSRTSLGTLADNRDYNRRLGVTNPDPERISSDIPPPSSAQSDLPGPSRS